MKQTLWTKNFTTLIFATVLGAAGGIAGGFAMSLLVYDETGSTLAAAILIAIQILPNFIIPLGVRFLPLTSKVLSSSKLQQVPIFFLTSSAIFSPIKIPWRRRT